MAMQFGNFLNRAGDFGSTSHRILEGGRAEFGDQFGADLCAPRRDINERRNRRKTDSYEMVLRIIDIEGHSERARNLIPFCDFGISYRVLRDAADRNSNVAV